MSLTIIVWIAVGLFGLLLIADDAAERGHRRSLQNTQNMSAAIRGGCGWGFALGLIGLLVIAAGFFILWLMAGV